MSTRAATSGSLRKTSSLFSKAWLLSQEELFLLYNEAPPHTENAVLVALLEHFGDRVDSNRFPRCLRIRTMLATVFPRSEALRLLVMGYLKYLVSQEIPRLLRNPRLIILFARTRHWPLS
jgi:hypothetical protein